MSGRQPNEVPIARELLEKLLSVGNVTQRYRVDRGPDPAATIVGARLEGHLVVLEYDRPVAEPQLTTVREGW